MGIDLLGSQIFAGGIGIIRKNQDRSRQKHKLRSVKFRLRQKKHNTSRQRMSNSDTRWIHQGKGH